MARVYHLLGMASAYDAIVITGVFPGGEEGTAYDESLPITGGGGVYALTASSGVPTGLTLEISGASLRLHGTPGEGTSSTDWTLSGTVADFDGAVSPTIHTQPLEITDPYGSLVLDQLALDGANGATGPYTNLGTSGSTWQAGGGGTPGLTTAVKKFGTASFDTEALDGALVAGTAVGREIGDEDFCIELWVQPQTNAAQFKHLVHIGSNTPAAGDFIILATNSGAVWRMFAQTYTTAVQDVIDPTAATQLTEDVWSHLAVTREGNVYRMFINGTLVASKTSALGHNLTYSGGVTIGVSPTGPGKAFICYVDDLRITRGEPRYTASFTAPTKAHPAP